MKRDQEILSQIPQVDKLFLLPALKEWNSRLSQKVRTRMAQTLLQSIRENILTGETCPSADMIAEELGQRFERLLGSSIKKAINATGIVLHTNLGRAPIVQETLECLGRELTGYCTHEMDLGKSARGDRTSHVELCLGLLVGSKETGALVVNNNAAAVFLALHVLAQGKDVLVSRGEIIQIGGGFRIHEILESSGANLVEVGTTNITSARDYEKRLTKETAAILKVHHSCFTMRGHTERPDTGALAKIARKKKLPLIIDSGSGDLSSVESDLASGADLVCFSGDKLLGGSQAGIIVGNAKLVSTLKKAPLYRALRLGKLELFVLEDVLHTHLKGENTLTQSLIGVTKEEIRARALELTDLLKTKGVRAETKEGEGSIGGGASPEEILKTVLIEITVPDSEVAARTLASHRPAIIVRKGKGKVQIDLRTVFPGDETSLVEGIQCLF